MSDIGINLAFNDSKVIKSWQTQIRLTQQLIANQRTLQGNVTAGLSRQQSGLQAVQRQSEKTNKSVGGMFTAFKGAAIVAGLVLVGKQILNVGQHVTGLASRMETLTTSFTVAYQSSSLAAEKLKLYQDIAAKTPFQFEELANSMLKLKNRGFDPTRKEIISLGDLAASRGKGFDQLVEAVLDAQTNEYERLKEFGIRAKTVGKDVQLTIRGQTTLVKNNAEAINEAITSMGNLVGISGSMEEQAKTLNGMLSTMYDNFDGLGRAIGAEVLPVLKPMIEGISEFIGQIDPAKVLAFFAPIRDVLLPALQELFYLVKGLVEETLGIEKAGTGVDKMNSLFLQTVDLVTLIVRGISGVVAAYRKLASVPGLDIILNPLKKILEAFNEISNFISYLSGDASEKSQNAAYSAADAAASKEKVRQGRVGRDGSSSKFQAHQEQIKKAQKEADAAAEKARLANAAAAKQALIDAEKYRVALKKYKDSIKELAVEINRTLNEEALSKEKDPVAKAQLQYNLNVQDIIAKRNAMIEEAKNIGIRGKLLKELTAQIDEQFQKLKDQEKLNLQIEKALIRMNEKRSETQLIEELISKDYERQAELLDQQIGDKEKAFELNETQLEGHLAEELRIIALHGKKKLQSEEEIAVEQKRAEIRAYTEKIHRYIAQADAIAALAKKQYIAQKLAENPNYKAEEDKNVARFDYDPTKDNALAGMRNTLNGMIDGLNTAIANIKPGSLQDKFWNAVGKALGIDNPEHLTMLKAAFTDLFKSITAGWLKSTQDQIAANDTLIQNIRSRRSALEQNSKYELELAQAGYANNVESKQAEIEELNRMERLAMLEGIKLKKKAATQELILSELAAGANMIEAVAKAFSSTSGIPFGVGIALAVAQIGTMFALYAGYKSQIKSLNSTALFTGGMPVDFLQPGNSARTDLPGSGQKGHRIEGTNLVMSAYEMILKEKTTKANLPFWKLANTGAFDNVNLMRMLPSINGYSSDTSKAVSSREIAQYMIMGQNLNAGFQQHLKGMIKYFDNKPTVIMSDGKVATVKKNYIKITR